MVIDGSPTVLINKMQACYVGNTILEAVGPPNKIVLGCFTVMIGAAAGGGAGGAGGAGAAAPGGIGSIGGMAIVKLPNGDIQVGKAITISGDDDFKVKTLAHLGQIAATPSGAALLTKIDGMGKNVTIKETGGGNSVTGFDGNSTPGADGKPGSGSDSTVNYNPDRTSLRDPGEAATKDNAWKDRPPAVGLAHELAHTVQVGTGSLDTTKADNDSKPDPTDPTKKEQELKAELDAAGIPPYDKNPYNENKIRSEWNPKQPQRPYY